MFMVAGGFVEAGDSISRTLMKEFEEEALNSLEMTQVCVMKSCMMWYLCCNPLLQIFVQMVTRCS